MSIPGHSEERQRRRIWPPRRSALSERTDLGARFFVAVAPLNDTPAQNGSYANGLEELGTLKKQLRFPRHLIYHWRPTCPQENHDLAPTRPDRGPTHADAPG